MMMKKTIFWLALCLLSLPSGVFGQVIGHWESRPPMPERRSNMAVASMQLGDTTFVYAFMGIDSSKACGSGIRQEAFRLNTTTGVWTQIADVPGAEGRIAASASSWNGKVYLMGGYKVFANCSEATSPKVDIYDPATDTWSAGADIPTPTDDHVQFLYRDSLIYTISGWSQNTNTRQTQIYDPANDAWSGGTIFPSSGLFGHCGAIWGDTLLVVDGVRIQGFNFVLTNQVVQGIIDPQDPSAISWTLIGTHPGSKVYRGGAFAHGGRVIVTGGTDNAYNIDGIGYNNVPSVESGRTFGYDFASGTWEDYARNPDSVMDVREVVRVGSNEYFVVGGMEAGQSVSSKVSAFVVDTVLLGRAEAFREDLVLELRMGADGRSHSIELSGTGLGPVVLQLWDIGGRLLEEQSLEGGNHRNLVRLENWSGGLPAGSYVLRAVQGDTGRALVFPIWD